MPKLPTVMVGAAVKPELENIPSQAETSADAAVMDVGPVTGAVAKVPQPENIFLNTFSGRTTPSPPRDAATELRRVHPINISSQLERPKVVAESVAGPVVREVQPLNIR